MVCHLEQHSGDAHKNGSLISIVQKKPSHAVCVQASTVVLLHMKRSHKDCSASSSRRMEEEEEEKDGYQTAEEEEKKPREVHPKKPREMSPEEVVFVSDLFFPDSLSKEIGAKTCEKGLKYVEALKNLCHMNRDGSRPAGFLGVLPFLPDAKELVCAVWAILSGGEVVEAVQFLTGISSDVLAIVLERKTLQLPKSLRRRISPSIFIVIKFVLCVNDIMAYFKVKNCVGSIGSRIMAIYSSLNIVSSIMNCLGFLFSQKDRRDFKEAESWFEEIVPTVLDADAADKS